MHISVLDLSIIVAYLLFAMAVGALSLRRSSRSTVAFFAAGRSLPGWLLGISMVATTFAVDTPLAVTGIVAGEGIAGNWFWWCTAIGHVGMIVIFGRLWRRSEVLTDAELVELRYGGRGAKVLRSVQACFFAVGVNAIVLGWGLAAMEKVTNAALPEGAFGWLPGGDPAHLLVVALVLFALLYSSLGGLRAVVITDLVQFAFAMTGSVALAWLAVREVGGLGPLREAIASNPETAHTLDLIPRLSAGQLVIATFATYLLIQWWARMHADGGGYLAQRMVAARDDHQARTAATWFVWMHYVVRPWPWIMVALAALVIFPVGGVGLPDGDREAAYPMLLMQLMPKGLLGIALASLLAAFMSTVDTHLNWGTSYLINDLYGRLIRPRAGRRELMIASWVGMVLMAALALGVASVIDSVEGAWKFLAAAGAGLGLPSLLRWVWWRMTSWAELTGMLVGTSTAAILFATAPEMEYAHRLWIVAGIGATSSLLVVFLGPAPDREAAGRFFQRVRPPGWWRPFGRGGQGMARLGAAWFLGVIGVYGVLLGTGKLLLGGPWLGALLVAIGIGAWFGSRALVKRADRDQAQG